MILLVLSFRTNPSPVRMASPNSPSLFLPGSIASIVGILDEIHQVYIPGRDASATDVMLDVSGITLTAIFIHYFQKRREK